MAVARHSPDRALGIEWLSAEDATTRASVELATVGFLSGELPVALVTPIFVPVSLAWPLSTWSVLLGLGLLFGLGNLTLIAAYAGGGKASVVTPLSSLYSVVTIPIAVWTLGERISLREASGILLALAAVVALCWEKPPSAVTKPNPQSPP
ncbi:MAG: EamA family transporter [Verrucomicrobiota bacterium]